MCRLLRWSIEGEEHVRGDALLMLMEQPSDIKSTAICVNVEARTWICMWSKWQWYGNSLSYACIYGSVSLRKAGEIGDGHGHGLCRPPKDHELLMS